MTEKFRWNIDLFLLTQYQDMHTETYDTMSEVLERYYAEKEYDHTHPPEIFRSSPYCPNGIDRDRKNTIFRKNS